MLRRNTTRSAGNKTFYLDSEGVAAIKLTATTQSVTESRLVNDILRTVLGIDS